MTMRRVLFTVGGLLLLSASSLAAQEMKVTCKDGSLSKGGQGACSSHGGIATKSVKSESKAAPAAAASAAKADKEAMKAASKADAKATKAETKSVSKEAKADMKAAKNESAASAKDAKAAATAEEKDAKGATALCKDNTYSHAKNKQGQCSGHGGVAKTLGK